MISLQIIILLAISTCSNSIFYDKAKSQTIFNYSYVTHCDGPSVQSWNCQICRTVPQLTMVSYIHNQATNVLCYVGYSPLNNTIVVAWRGTKDVKNWIEDFAFDLIEYPRCKNCKVHDGFYFDYKSVEKRLLASVETILQVHSNAIILVTGSSLGSSLAAISAIELELKFRKQTEFHTFGCPRTGNIQFAQFFTQNIKNRIRVIHNRDIVPHVPFLTLGYHHFAYEVLYDEQMQNYTICNDSGEDPHCSNRFDPKYSVEDHITYWIESSAQIC